MNDLVERRVYGTPGHPALPVIGIIRQFFGCVLLTFPAEPNRIYCVERWKPDGDDVRVWCRLDREVNQTA